MSQIQKEAGNPGRSNRASALWEALTRRVDAAPMF
jgi:hypothetical protein